MENKPASPVKKFAKMMSNTSQSLLASFLHDSSEHEAEKKALAGTLKKLHQAAAQDSLVVLQVQSVENPQKFETLSGWVAVKTISEDKVMIRLQGEDQPLRMVPTKSIRKVTSLTLKNGKKRISH